MELSFPYEGKVYFASPFGNRILNGLPDWHNGIDLVGQESKRIVAPCDGVIGNSAIITDKNNKTWEWGNYVRLDTSDGLQIFMCHMSERFAVPGQSVKRGDLIGKEGNTGYSFGSHCHFEVRKNGSPINPCPLLGIENKAGVIFSNSDFQQPVEKLDGNTPHEWAADSVEWAIYNDILRGSGADFPEYRLHDAITREEMLVFLHRALSAAGLVE